MNLIKFLFAFFVLISTIFEKVKMMPVNKNNLNRVRREFFQNALAVGIDAAATAYDSLQQGVKFEDGHKTGFDVFGVPVGGEYGVKTGFGESMRNDDDDDNRQKRDTRDPDNIIPDGQQNIDKQQMINKVVDSAMETYNIIESYFKQ